MPAPEPTIREHLSSLGLALPLSASEDDPGSIMDAAGLEILTVDILGTMPADEATALAEAVAKALNALDDQPQEETR